MIIIVPVAAENPALRVHLSMKRGVRKGSEGQDKGGLQLGLNNEFCELVENRGSILIKADYECAHNTDFAFMKAANRICIFICPVWEFMHGINCFLR